MYFSIRTSEKCPSITPHYVFLHDSKCFSAAKADSAPSMSSHLGIDVRGEKKETCVQNQYTLNSRDASTPCNIWEGKHSGTRKLPSCHFPPWHCTSSPPSFEILRWKAGLSECKTLLPILSLRLQLFSNHSHLSYSSCSMHDYAFSSGGKQFL